jgi:CMP-N-acetylneuraminic acid synthetase
MLLGGKTLLEWTAAAIDEAGLGAPCIFTTDDPGLAMCGRRLGWIVPFTRPPELARDESPTADAVLHALDWFVGEGNAEPDYLLLVQTTSPLRKGSDLAAALDLLRRGGGADAVIGVVETEGTRHGAYWLDARGFLTREAGSGRARVQPNGAVYVIEPPQLRRRRSFYTPQTLGYMMDALDSIDIDTIEDWRAAESALALRAAAATSPRP